MGRDRKRKIRDLLSEIYYSASSASGYGSRRNLARIAAQLAFERKILPVKVNSQSVWWKELVEEWWRGELIPTRFRSGAHIFTRSIFVARRANETWLGDLADFGNLSSFNKGVRWLLIVQDLFSRSIKLLAAQRKKTSEETAHSLDSLFASASRENKLPNRFLTDKGGEFFGKSVEVYKKWGVRHYTTKDVTQKVAPVERAIRKVKARLYKIMAREGSWRWTDKLNAVRRAYNEGDNRNLGTSPEEAEKPENKSSVFYNSVVKKETKVIGTRPKGKKILNEGDVVRILRSQQFGKSYTGMFSEILYVIYEVGKRAGGVTVYYLQELLSGEKVDGIFYGSELEKVDISNLKLPRVKKIHGRRLVEGEREEVNVSYEGDPSGKREWIVYSNLIPYSSS